MFGVYTSRYFWCFYIRLYVPIEVCNVYVACGHFNVNGIIQVYSVLTSVCKITRHLSMLAHLDELSGGVLLYSKNLSLCDYYLLDEHKIVSVFRFTNTASRNNWGTCPFAHQFSSVQSFSCVQLFATP